MLKFVWKLSNKIYPYGMYNFYSIILQSRKIDRAGQMITQINIRTELRIVYKFLYTIYISALRSEFLKKHSLRQTETTID